MQYEDAIVSKIGIEVGAFVLAVKANSMYGRVVRIQRRFATGACVRYQHGKNKVRAGDEMSSILTVQKILNLDMNEPKRKSRSLVEDDKIIVIDKDFISLLFIKLNNTAAYVKIINEQEEIT